MTLPILRFDASALPDASTTLPSEFRILKFGQNKFWKIGQDKEGELLFDADSAKSVMDGFAAKGLDSIAIDLDHQIVNGGGSDTAGKSYGWFVPEVRADGLYAANVKWTPEGAALLKGKSYRFFSPTVQTDDDGRVTDLLPLALTNMPALKGIPALVAAKATLTGSKSKMNISILSALGLNDGDDEKKALEVVEQLTEVRTQILSLSGKSTMAEALGALHALKAQAEQMVTLKAELDQLKNERAKNEIDSLIDAAVVDGRVTPAKRAHVEKFAATFGAEGLKSYLDLLPKQPAQAATVMPPKEELKAPADLSIVAGIFGLSADQLKSGRTTLPVGDAKPQNVPQLVFGFDAVASRAPSLPVARPNDDR